MEFNQLIAFLILTALLTLTPGADTAFIASSTMKRGMAGAFIAMLGVSVALFIWTILVAIGFVALVTKFPFANKMLIAVGAFYMGYIGVKDIQLGLALRNNLTIISPQILQIEPLFALFKKGFITNMTNPKIGFYYATVLPTFISEDSSKGYYIIFMGLIHILMGFVWLMTFAFLLIKGADVFGAEKTKANMTLLTGFFLIIFAVLSLLFLLT